MPKVASARPHQGPLFINTVLLGGTPEEKLRAAQAAGFDQVELWTDDVEALDGGAARARVLSSELGLGFTDYQVLMDFDGAPGGKRDAKRAEATRLLDAALVLGSSTVLAPASTDPDCDRSRIAEDMSWLVGEAQARGLRIAYEGMAWSTINPRLASAYETIRDLDPRHAGMVIDAYHLFVTGGTIADLVVVPADRIFLVQFSDVVGPVVPEDYRDAARTARLLPGEGTLPLRELADRLREMNYEGPWGLEVFNDEMKEQPPLEVAQRAIAALRSL